MLKTRIEQPLKICANRQLKSQQRNYNGILGNIQLISPTSLKKARRKKTKDQKKKGSKMQPTETTWKRG